MSKPDVLILGARSDIARPLARIYAEDGYGVILAARHSDMLEDDAADLRIRFGRYVEVRDFDALDTGAHLIFLDGLEIIAGYGHLAHRIDDATSRGRNRFCGR